MVLRLLVIGWIGVLAVPDRSVSAEPGRDRAKDHIERAMAFLDTGEWDLSKAAEAVDTLAKLAPSDRKAQLAARSYFERVGHTIEVPLCFARLLSCFDSGFAAELMASLTKQQQKTTKQLWLLTIAMMGTRAGGQVEPLRKHIEKETDPVTQMFARVAYATIWFPPADNAKKYERDIHDRTPAGAAAVQIGTALNLRAWASEKSIADIKDWLTDEDVPEDYRCLAAVALALSDCRDELVERSIRARLERAMLDPVGSTRILYAYALALLDAPHADRYWRIIFKKIGGNFNHTDVAALLLIGNSIRGSHIEIIKRLRNDPDHEVAAGLKKIEPFLDGFLRSVARSEVHITIALPHWDGERSKAEAILTFSNPTARTCIVVPPSPLNQQTIRMASPDRPTLLLLARDTVTRHVEPSFVMTEWDKSESKPAKAFILEPGHSVEMRYPLTSFYCWGHAGPLKTQGFLDCLRPGKRTVEVWAMIVYGDAEASKTDHSVSTAAVLKCDHPEWMFKHKIEDAEPAADPADNTAKAPPK
jgi:hypothetical protein